MKRIICRDRVIIVPGKCRDKWCENKTRNMPGSTHCIEHRSMETAGCAAHDKLRCKNWRCK